MAFHEITDEGSHVLITSNGIRPSKLRINKSTCTLRVLKDGGNGGSEFIRISEGPTTVIDIYHADVISPVTANLAALEVAIGPYFFKEAASGSATTLELLDLLTAISVGGLTAGSWIFVPDLPSTDEGGWLFATSTSTVALEGVGNFLNCDWNNSGNGDYSGVQAITGVAFGGTNYGQWSPESESFTIFYSGLTGGTFAVGDVVTGTSTWTGVVLSDNGANSMSVYSTAKDRPLTTDVIQSGSVSADVDTVGVKSLQGNIYCYLGPDGKIHHFQCVDSTKTSGDIFTPAYEVLERSETNVGYLRVADKIEFDLANQWLQMRSDNQNNFWRMTKFVNDTFAWSYSEAPFPRFPWGKDNITGVKIDNGDNLCENLLTSYLFDVSVKTGGKFKVTTPRNVVSIGGITLGLSSNFDVTIEAPFIGIRIGDYLQYTNKTYTGMIVDKNMYVTETDTATETFAYANWTSDGYRFLQYEFDAAELLSDLAFSGGVGGLEIIPPTSGKYVAEAVYNWELHYGTTAFTTASKAGFYSHETGSLSATLLASLPSDAFTHSADRVVPNIIPQMTSSNDMPSHGVGERVIVKLANGANQATGDGNLRVSAKYKLKTF